MLILSWYFDHVNKCPSSSLQTRAILFAYLADLGVCPAIHRFVVPYSL